MKALPGLFLPFAPWIAWIQFNFWKKKGICIHVDGYADKFSTESHKS